MMNIFTHEQVIKLELYCPFEFHVIIQLKYKLIHREHECKIPCM